MRNITVTVSDETYRQALVWAASRDTSVSAVVAYLLQTLPAILRAARRFPACTPESVKPNPVTSTIQTSSTQLATPP